MKVLKRAFISFTLLNYLFLALFGLLAMDYIHMNAPMNHCPFMTGQSSLCSMSSIEHVRAFENTVRTVTVPMVFLALPLLLVFFILNLRPSHSFIRIRPREDFFSMLFSRGILHSKAP